MAAPTGRCSPERTTRKTLSLNEDETVHCYPCNTDSDLTSLRVATWRDIGSSVVAAAACPACGRAGELHLDRSPRAGAAEREALAVLLGERDVCAA
jgi:hypothetical protein